MDFSYSEEQRQLADSIGRFVDRYYDFEARRRIVESPSGWSREVWRALGELGVLALPLPVDHGGFGGRVVDVMPFMDAVGEALIVEPYVATLVGARLVGRSPSESMREDLLRAVSQGRLRMAFAHAERGARYDAGRVEARARHTEGCFVIDGEKSVVDGAPCADRMIVSARLHGGVNDPDGVALFVVDAAAPGVSMIGYRALDGRRSADVRFDGVRVAEAARVDAGADALGMIDDALDYATALVCAEAVGALRYAKDATLEYTKTRRQFGVPIASFQALQHRLVDMFIDCEQATSVALLACAAVDAEDDALQRKRTVSAAKLRISEACRRVSQEAVQLHGGMGMSDEMKLSHTFRRLTLIAQQFGDEDHHLERFAACDDALLAGGRTNAWESGS
jgi:alkylation response protein AidB-like acyl-CoA dehydrogenase